MSCESNPDAIENPGLAGAERPKHRRVPRWVTMVVAALALLACASWAVWSLGVPRYRPHLRRGEAFGIDVSHHQGPIDWPKVARSGIAFAYLKSTEGGDHVDPSFAANFTAASSAGLRVGAYHFFTFCRPGAEQAANFLAIAPPSESWLAPAVDVEFGGNCSKRPASDVVQREFASFVQIVERAWARKVLVYVLHDTEARYHLESEPGRVDNPLWQRHLFLRPKGHTWSVWQVSGFARVPGVSGPVDLNVGSPRFLGPAK